MNRPIRNLALLVPLALSSAAFAQGDLVWSRSFNSWTTGGYPTYSTDVALGACFDPQGAVYLTGYVTGSPTTNPPIDPLTVKILPDGTLGWARAYDASPTADRGRAIGADPNDGSVYVATSTDASDSVVVLLKYDAAGNLAWASTPYAGPGPGPDRVAVPALPIDGAGNVYLALTSVGASQDAVVLSYDPSGGLRWEVRLDGAAGLADRPTALAIDRSDNVFVGSNLDSAQNESGNGPRCAITKIAPGGAVAWTAITDAAGTANSLVGLACDLQGSVYSVVWDSPYAVIKHDAAGAFAWSAPIPDPVAQISSIAVDPLGSATVVGTNGSAPFTGDLLVFHYRPDGGFAWSSSWDGPSNDHDRGVLVTTDATGEITVAGTTSTWTSQTLTTTTRFVVQRYSPHGAREWSSLYGSQGAWPNAIEARGDGSVLVGGSISTTASTQPPMQQSDVIGMKFKDDYQRICAGDESFGACPCSNASPAGTAAGCSNSAGLAAKMNRTGQAKLGADTLVLTTSGELPTVLSIVLQGESVVAPAAFGDGLRCIGGGLKRLYVRNAVGGVVVVPQAGDPSVSARSAELGEPISAGSTRGYQTFYRDPDASFCTAPQGNNWNISSGLRITWAN